MQIFDSMLCYRRFDIRLIQYCKYLYKKTIYLMYLMIFCKCRFKNESIQTAVGNLSVPLRMRSSTGRRRKKNKC
jgi:hypothetical protein